jgi:hypothetical protein
MAKVQGTLGDGINTSFDIDTGFSTETPAVRLFDLTRDGNEIIAYQMQKQTPNSTSIRLGLTPAPEVDQVQYVITDGSEAPDPS